MDETLTKLTRLAEEASRLDSIGHHDEADRLDEEFTRLAYFKSIQKFKNDPRAQFFGGVNPALTGNSTNFFSQFQQLATPCGAIRLPMGVSTGSNDPEALAQAVMDAIQQQCPQLAANEAAMQQYYEELVQWANEDYAMAKQQGVDPGTPPSASTPQYNQMQQQLTGQV